MFFSNIIDTGTSGGNGNGLSFSAFSTIALAATGQQYTTDCTTGIAGLVGSIYPISFYMHPDRFKLLFGENSTQSTSALIIKKSDLTGLEPSVNNTAESLFVGLLNRILSGKNLVELPGLTFTYWGYGLTEGKRIDTIIINARKKLDLTNTYEISEENSTIVNPNNY